MHLAGEGDDGEQEDRGIGLATGAVNLISRPVYYDCRPTHGLIPFYDSVILICGPHVACQRVGQQPGRQAMKFPLPLNGSELVKREMEDTNAVI